MSGLSRNETERLIGLLWPEFKEEIEVWIEQLRMILEDSNDEVSLREIHQAQGSLRALRNVLQLPETILEQKQSNEEEQDDAGTRSETFGD